MSSRIFFADWSACSDGIGICALNLPQHAFNAVDRFEHKLLSCNPGRFGVRPTPGTHALAVLVLAHIFGY